MTRIEVPSLACAAGLFRNIRGPQGNLCAAVMLSARPLDQAETDPVEELALLDTGSELTILSREWALAHGLFPFASAPTVPLNSRFGILYGNMVSCWLSIPELEGQPLAWEGEVWISENWPGPSVIGWRGVLDRLRMHLHTKDGIAHFDIA